MRLLHGLCLAILGCTLVSVSVAQAGQMSLKHKNVECAVCHGTDKPTKIGSARWMHQVSRSVQGKSHSQCGLQP